MSIRTFQLARAGSLASLVLMIGGHFGPHHLDWTRAPISTYAAQAPWDEWISAAMILSALSGILTALACHAAASPRDVLAQSLPVVSGMAAGGLFLVAAFEEPTSYRSDTVALTQDEIRVVAFHDAGLALFVASAWLLLLLGGVQWIRKGRGVRRWLGSAPILAAFVSQVIRSPTVIPSEFLGISQRSSLFCLWLGLTAMAFWFPRIAETEIHGKPATTG